jgi:hypothetical protein
VFIHGYITSTKHQKLIGANLSYLNIEDPAEKFEAEKIYHLKP